MEDPGKKPDKKTKKKKEKKQSKEKGVPSITVPDAPFKDIRRSIVNELIATEETYIEGLHRLQEVFVKKIEEQGLLAADVRRNLFGQINILLGMNERLLADLKTRHASWDGTSSISDIFLEFIPFMKIYSQYIENFDASQKTLAVERDQNKKLAALLDEGMAEAGGQSIGAHMILPVQRLPRYQLLLRELVKRTDESHPDVEGLNKALVEIVEVVTKVNAQKAVADRRRKTMEKLAMLDRSDSIIVLHQHNYNSEANLVGMLEVVVDSVTMESAIKDRCYFADLPVLTPIPVSSPRETLKTKPMKMSDLQVIWKEELVFLVKDPHAFDITSQLIFELHDLSSKKKSKVAQFKISVVDIKDKYATEETQSFDMYNPTNPADTVGTLRVSFAYIQDRLQTINVNAVGSTIGRTGNRTRRRSASITAGSAPFADDVECCAKSSDDDMSIHVSKRAEKKKKSHFNTLKRNVAKGGTIIARPILDTTPASPTASGSMSVLDQLRVDQPEDKGSILDQLSPRGRKSSSSSKGRSPNKSPSRSVIKTPSVQRTPSKSPGRSKRGSERKKEREEKKKERKITQV